MATTTLPSTAPVERPKAASGPLLWLRKNLFRTPLDTLLTLIVAYLVITLGAQFVTWVTTQAQWEVITVNFRILMQGRYPAEQGWRVGLSVILATLLAGISWGIWGKMFRTTAVAFVLGLMLFVVLPLAEDVLRLSTQDDGTLARYLGGEVAPLVTLLRDPALVLMGGLLVGYGFGRAAKRWNRKAASRATLVLWAVLIVVVFLLVRGFTPGTPVLPLVQTNLWGGLLLTFMLAFVAIVACFPLGILLALGRVSGGKVSSRAALPPRWWLNPAHWPGALAGYWRSLGPYPILKLLCIVYIELFRGVPLVTVFFTANLIVPLALGDANIDTVVRAMVALTLFEAAYIAEIVRGGLQALPPGQGEAARAIGLGPVLTTLLITLPQALRIVIPALVGQFITMFKDTSLVAIIGLFDLFGVSRSVLAQTDYINQHRETYLFVALVYFVFSYGMSVAARQLERSGSGAFRRIN